MLEQWLQVRIESIAEKYCKDYPHKKDWDTPEQLYAIEQTLKGLTLANQDLHNIINKD